MIYVLLENEGPGDQGAKTRNDHIKKTAARDSRNFPNIFGPVVTTEQEVKAAAQAQNAILHVFAHGNSQMIGRFERKDKSDTTAAQTMTDFLSGDPVRIGDESRKNLKTIRFHSCYASSHLPQLGSILRHVIPSGRELTLEGAYRSAYTDAAGNLRSARTDDAAHALDQAVADDMTAERFNQLLEQNCEEVGKGLKKVTVKGTKT